MSADSEIRVFVPSRQDGMVSLEDGLKQVSVSATELAQQVKEITSAVVGSLSTVDDASADRYVLEEVEISLGVSANGKVGMLGLGAELGGSSCFRVIFKRKQE